MSASRCRWRGSLTVTSCGKPARMSRTVVECIVVERTSEQADRFLARLREMQNKYAMKMPTVADRLTERFVRRKSSSIRSHNVSRLLPRFSRASTRRISLRAKPLNHGIRSPSDRLGS